MPRLSVPWGHVGSRYADFAFWVDGSIVILDPLNEAAERWCGEHLPEDAPRWAYNGYAIEARMFIDIYNALDAAGYRLECLG